VTTDSAPPAKAGTTAVLVGALVSVAALNASTGLDAWWLPAWVAPIGVLVAAYRLRWPAAAVLSFTVFLLGTARLVPYLTSLVPLPFAIGFLALRALAWMLVVLLARAAERRLPATVSAFSFAAAWTAVEFVASASPHGTFLSLAYSQADFLPLLQIASLCGLWGVTFVLTLVPSAFAVAIHRRSARVANPALACAAAVLVFGVWRLETAPQVPAVRVGLAATDVGAGVLFVNTDAAVARRVTAEYAERIARLGQQGAIVAVLPEKLVGVPPAATADVSSTLGTAARAAHVTVVAGLNLTSIAPPRNVAVVAMPDGHIVGEYDKHHLLPGPETGYAVGASPLVFDAPGGPWGVAICKDMDFPAWSRRYGQRGVRIMAVPAWDFVRDGRLHARMAVLRGVENGFAMARVAMEGVLTVSDAYGRIVSETTSAWRPDALLVAAVPPGPGATFYTRTGDWFGWVTVAGAMAFVAFAARRPERRG